MSGFGDLLEQSKRLANQTGKSEFVMMRSLDELSRESKKVLFFFF